VKSITLSADEHLIESAEERARARDTTLNEEFQRWLAEYTGVEERLRRFDETVRQLQGKVRVGRKLTREEMNER
jgi:hypothetical protein